MPIKLCSASLVVLTACAGGLHLGGGSTTRSATGPRVPSDPDTGAPAVAATRFSDFADLVKTATGDYHTGWIIDKLTTFHVADACYAKMLDADNNGAVHAATFYTRDIAQLAKVLTGDDWSAIETQNNSDRENNKKLVEPMIDRFKQHFGMSITVEGDDCDARQSSMWLRYWTTVSAALAQHPPAADHVFVNLVVKPSVQAVAVTFDEATATYSIVGPRDIEPKSWSGPIEKAIERHARGGAR